MRRRGKYQRIDRSGQPIFTFGDPILDLITDEHGWISIGRENYNLLSMGIGAAHERRGGIASIDLGLDPDELRRQQTREATTPGGGRTLWHTVRTG
jgi:hypothetical protein